MRVGIGPIGLEGLGQRGPVSCGCGGVGQTSEEGEVAWKPILAVAGITLGIFGLVAWGPSPRRASWGTRDSGSSA